MMFLKKIHIHVLALGMLSLSAAKDQPYKSSFNMEIPFVPAAVRIGGANHVYYELHLSNFGKTTWIVEGLEVVSLPDSAVVARFEGKSLLQMFSEISGINNKSLVMQAGTVAVIYLELKVKERSELLHKLRLKRVEPGSFPEVIHGAKLNIGSPNALVLGAPLNGGPWAAVYEPSWERGHRRVMFTIDGQARIPGRFAIDFIHLNEGGRYAKGDENIITNWAGYGREVLAVADGEVVTTRSDFNESQTISGHPKYPAEQATGNYISIKIGEDQFAFYEHLQPASIRVQAGDRVRKGDVIARIGFTGQSTGPHLHFHVANQNSPLGAEGIPFVFESFKLLGSYEDFSSFGKKVWSSSSGGDSAIVNERPAPNSVIIF